MVCPACITAALMSQLPAISAAAMSAAGVKLALDKRSSTKAVKFVHKVQLKVHFCQTSRVFPSRGRTL